MQNKTPHVIAALTIAAAIQLETEAHGAHVDQLAKSEDRVISREVINLPAVTRDEKLRKQRYNELADAVLEARLKSQAADPRRPRFVSRAKRPVNW
jgi:hypothetical protein